jgi:hypothetical protein
LPPPTDDTGWQARLGLGIARSCISSTRFVLDRKLARQLFLLGVYLMESLLEWDGPAGEYHMPGELFHG